MPSMLLALNTGSSSVKFRVFQLAPDLPLIAGGKVTDIGGNAAFKVSLEGGEEERPELPANTTHESAVSLILEWLDKNGLGSHMMAATAHRIVHGGDRFDRPVFLDADALNYLETLNKLAPLHQPHNLAGVKILADKLPEIPQYGCFDTAFHARHNALFREFALPADIRNKGVKRYGFHGLSYDWIVHSLAENNPHLLHKRVVAAHLGNGSSLCAIQNGKSIDTTMGMTALDGLPMGTRCGALDAGALIYMIRDMGLSVDEAERILYEESGLKGLSEISNDAKILSESTDPKATFALDYYALKAAQNIAAMAVSIGGMDALVFTGGIGENATDIREKILNHLAFLPPFETHVIAANEERSMAQEIFELFFAAEKSLNHDQH